MTLSQMNLASLIGTLRTGPKYGSSHMSLSFLFHYSFLTSPSSSSSCQVLSLERGGRRSIAYLTKERGGSQLPYFGWVHLPTSPAQNVMYLPKVYW